MDVADEMKSKQLEREAEHWAREIPREKSRDSGGISSRTYETRLLPEILPYIRRWGIRRTIAVALACFSRKLDHGFDFEEVDRLISPAQFEQKQFNRLRNSFPKYALDERYSDEIASLLAVGIPRYLAENNYAKYFAFWESKGFHITRNHFYEPIPDTRSLKEEIWERESQLVGVDMNVDYQLHLLRDIFPKFSMEYNEFPMKRPRTDYGFYFDNPMFSGTDALVLYCMIRYFKPKTVLEIGGGFSTRAIAEAALRNGDTRVVCIEPNPDPILRNGFPGLTKLITDKVENVGLDPFLALSLNDILFIDTSHCLKIGGDVHFLYLEALPRLKEGVIVQIHDIFFPMEIPRDWVLRLYKFWTEQYLVQAFLAFNRAFEVMFSNSYMGLKYGQDMRNTFPKSPWHGGGSLWIRRRNAGKPSSGD